MKGQKLSEVAILRVGEKSPSSLRSDVYEILDYIGAWNDVFADNKKRVLIKPNLCYPRQSGSGVITDGRIVFALVEILCDLGFKNIVLGEGSAVGYDFVQNYDTWECIRAAGLESLQDTYGVKIVDFNRDEAVEVDVPNPLVMDKVKIAKSVLECDIIVNMPVIKTHIRTFVTLGLKNMKGVLPGNEKKKTHRLGLDEAIADLNSVVTPDVTLVDGIVGMEGNWEYPRDCVPLGILVAGKDPVAVDTICTRIMGYDPKKIRHLSCAAQKNLGTMDERHIIVKGLSLDQIQIKPFKPRFQAFMEDFPGVNIIDQYGCTGCYSGILSALVHLNKKGFKGRLNNLNLVLAIYDSTPLDNITGKTVVIGKCNAKFKDKAVFVPGCPPRPLDIVQAIAKEYGFEVDEKL